MMVRLFYLLMLCISTALSAQTYNVRSFIPKGQNANIITDYFDKAIEAVCSTGGELVVPKGQYILDGKSRSRAGIYASYIFLVRNNVNIVFEPGAILCFKNGFQGFRFRSLKHPTPVSRPKYDVKITGGKVDASKNWVSGKKDNPQIWAFVGEVLRNFTVKKLQVASLYGSAAVAAYSCGNVSVSGCALYNVTGNLEDLIDNHGDGIYTANCKTYQIYNNKIINYTNSRRIGRVGICIEYEGSGKGSISNNEISGYDRAIHVELIKGSATVKDNILTDNSSGITLWNNYGNPQILQGNKIIYKNLRKDNKPLLYTSAPILMLGYDTNKGTKITGNYIKIFKTSFVPNNLVQITSSDVSFENNIINDETRTLGLAVAQGQSRIKRVKNVAFTNKIITTGSLTVYDGCNITIRDNMWDLSEITASFDNTENYYKRNSIKSSNATIGAGSVVVKDIPENATAVGNYAKVINFNRPAKYINNRYPC